MSEYGDKVQAKCDAFADRVIKLNDYLLQLERKKSEVRRKSARQYLSICILLRISVISF